MKRTATTLVLLAGFGGGCATSNTAKQPAGGFGTVTHGREMNQFQGPNGEPVMAATARGTAARGAAPDNSFVQPAVFRKFGSPSAADLRTVAYVPGCSDGSCAAPGGGYGPPGMGGPGCAPSMAGMPNPGNMPGIYPVPGQGPPGAVAAMGAMVPGRGGPGMAATGAIPNGRSSIKFTGPAGMKITWQLPTGGFNDEATGLTAPKEYNFLQGQTYRLRLSQILPNFPGKSFYPTLQVGDANPKSVKFLAHSCVPVTFTNEDFEQATAGNLVVKVVYLPDRDNQDFLSVGGGIEELVSTRLEPGADPVAEAQRKGTILAVITLGNIDLENRVSPPMNAMPMGGMMMPPGAMMLPPGAMPPGALPPGAMPPGAMGAFPPGMSSVSGPMAPGRVSLPSITPTPAAPLAPGLKPGAPVSLPPIK